ncbi:MAG: ATP-binding protein, partial [Candidatus Omnitrophica bacterium]|nr:ATP-binding protein [Candidatus Omnitrophota bacterium]
LVNPAVLRQEITYRIFQLIIHEIGAFFGLPHEINELLEKIVYGDLEDAEHLSIQKAVDKLVERGVPPEVVDWTAEQDTTRGEEAAILENARYLRNTAHDMGNYFNALLGVLRLLDYTEEVDSIEATYQIFKNNLVELRDHHEGMEAVDEVSDFEFLILRGMTNMCNGMLEKLLGYLLRIQETIRNLSTADANSSTDAFLIERLKDSYEMLLMLLRNETTEIHAVEVLQLAGRSEALDRCLQVPTINVSPAGADPVLLMREGIFLRIFVNILRNGCEACMRVSGEIISISVTDDVNKVRIVITDKGRGMTEEQMTAYRAQASGFSPHGIQGIVSSKNQSVHAQEKGYGRGCKEVLSLVGLLGGETSVRRPETGGTEFTVVLPKNLETAAPVADRAAKGSSKEEVAVLYQQLLQESKLIPATAQEVEIIENRFNRLMGDLTGMEQGVRPLHMPRAPPFDAIRTVRLESLLVSARTSNIFLPDYDELPIYLVEGLESGAFILTNEADNPIALVIDARLVTEEPYAEFGILEGVKRTNLWVLEHELIALLGGLTHAQVKELQEWLAGMRAQHLDAQGNYKHYKGAQHETAYYLSKVYLPAYPANYPAEAARYREEIRTLVHLLGGMIMDYSADNGKKAAIAGNIFIADTTAYLGRILTEEEMISFRDEWVTRAGSLVRSILSTDRHMCQLHSVFLEYLIRDRMGIDLRIIGWRGPHYCGIMDGKIYVDAFPEGGFAGRTHGEVLIIHPGQPLYEEYRAKETASTALNWNELAPEKLSNHPVFKKQFDYELAANREKVDEFVRSFEEAHDKQSSQRKLFTGDRNYERIKPASSRALGVNNSSSRVGFKLRPEADHAPSREEIKEALSGIDFKDPSWDISLSIDHSTRVRGRIVLDKAGTPATQATVAGAGLMSSSFGKDVVELQPSAFGKDVVELQSSLVAQGLSAEAASPAEGSVATLDKVSALDNDGTGLSVASGSVSSSVARDLAAEAASPAQVPSATFKVNALDSMNAALISMMLGEGAIAAAYWLLTLSVLPWLSIPLAAVLVVGGLSILYAAVMFLSQGIRVALAHKNNGVKGLAIFNKPIATPTGKETYFDTLPSALKASIDVHEAAHRAGKHEIGAYVRQARYFLSDGWKIIVHAGLLLGATKLALLAGASYGLFFAIVPSFLALTGIFYLWKDEDALRNGDPVGLLYIANIKLTLAESLAINESLKSSTQNKTHEGFADRGLIETISGVFTPPGHYIGWIFLGAILGTSPAGIGLGTLIGAVFGIAAAYLLNVLWNFFWSYMVHDAHLQKIAQNYKAGKLSEADSTKIASLVKQFEDEIARASGIGKAQYSLSALLVRAAITFPAATGSLKFLLGRLQMILWGSVLALGVLSFFDISLASFSFLDAVGLSALKSGFNGWGLAHTVEGLLRLVIIVIALKVFSSSYITLRNQLQNLFARNQIESLNGAWIYENYERLNRTTISDLLAKGIINVAGRPGLAALLTERLARDGIVVSPASFVEKQMHQFKYYLSADILAVGFIVSSPFAGILYLGHRIFRGFSKEFSRTHPYYLLWLAKGREFWVSFWHMWLISAEIGAVIGSGNYAAQHPLLKYVGGEELGKIAELLEGRYGAIAWGNHILESVNTTFGFNLSQIVHTAFGGTREVTVWEQTYQAYVDLDGFKDSRQVKTALAAVKEDAMAKPFLQAVGATKSITISELAQSSNISAPELSTLIENATIDTLYEARMIPQTREALYTEDGEIRITTLTELVKGKIALHLLFSGDPSLATGRTEPVIPAEADAKPAVESKPAVTTDVAPKTQASASEEVKPAEIPAAKPVVPTTDEGRGKKDEVKPVVPAPKAKPVPAAIALSPITTPASAKTEPKAVNTPAEVKPVIAESAQPK